MCSLSIRSMHVSMDLQETLTEEYWARVRVREEQQREFRYAADMLAILMEDDPEGWQAWFDATITHETSMAEAVELMGTRILDVNYSRVPGALETVNMQALMVESAKCMDDPERELVLNAVAHSYMIASGKWGA